MPKYDKRCKVCNSAFKSRIESLALQGMNPQQIYEYLQSIQDPNEKLIVQRENIAPSSIRRHLDNHFDRSEIGRIHDAEVDDKLKYPLIVKPGNLGSSVGIKKVKDAKVRELN